MWKGTCLHYIDKNVLICSEENAGEFLTSLFIRILKSEKMLDDRRRSVLIEMFRKKGDGFMHRKYPTGTVLALCLCEPIEKA